MKRDTLQHQINVIAEKARKWEITQIAEERGDGHVTREDSHRTWLAYEYARDALIDRLCGEEEGEEPSPSEDGVERLAQNLYAADHPDDNGTSPLTLFGSPTAELRQHFTRTLGGRGWRRKVGRMKTAPLHTSRPATRSAG